MRIKALADLHKNVVHGRMEHSQYCQATCAAHRNEDKPRYSPKHCQVCKEEIWIQKYPYDALSGVCEECFGNPWRFVTSADLEPVKYRFR